MQMQSSQKFPPGSKRETLKHKKLERRVEEKLAKFNQLQCIDHNTKRDFQQDVRSKLEQIALLELKGEKVEKAGTICFFIFLPLIVVSVYVFADISLRSSISTMLFSFLIFLILTFFGILPIKLQMRDSSPFFISSFVVLIGSGFGCYYLYPAQIHLNFFLSGLLIAFLTEIAFWLFCYFVLLILLLYTLTIRRDYRTNYPTEALIDNLILILHNAEKNPSNRSSLSYKKQQTLYIEEAAKIIERYIPDYVSSGDDTLTTLWYRKESRQTATYLRYKKRSLLKSALTTRNDFVTEIKGVLINVLNDNWDALDSKDLEKLMKEENFPRPQSWSSRIKSLSKAVCLAFSPAVLYFGISKLFHITIPDVWAFPITVVYVVWIIIILYFDFDPNLRNKIALFTSTISNFIPGADKNSKDRSQN